MNKGKILKRAKLFILIITIIYATITVLAAISAIGDMKNNSTTNVGIGSIFSLIWFQLLVIAFLGFTYYTYYKRGSKGLIIEFIIAMALMLNVIINIVISKANNPLVFLNFVIPVIILLHTFLTLINIYKLDRTVKIKALFNVK